MGTLKDVVSANVDKQVDCILDTLGLDPARFRTSVNKSLVMAMHKLHQHGQVVLDARDAQLLKYAIAMRDSNSYHELVVNIGHALPKFKNKVDRLISLYHEMFAGQVKYRFSIPFLNGQNNHKEEEPPKPAPVLDETLNENRVAIQTVIETLAEFESRLNNFEKYLVEHGIPDLKALERFIREHTHDGTTGKPAIKVTFDEYNRIKPDE